METNRKTEQERSMAWTHVQQGTFIFIRLQLQLVVLAATSSLKYSFQKGFSNMHNGKFLYEQSAKIYDF